MPDFKFWKKPKPPTRTPQAYRFSTVINEARTTPPPSYLTLVPFIRLRGSGCKTPASRSATRSRFTSNPASSP